MENKIEVQPAEKYAITLTGSEWAHVCEGITYLQKRVGDPIERSIASQLAKMVQPLATENDGQGKN